VSRAPARGASSAPAGKGVAPRSEVQDRAGWLTYHGNFALDGVAAGPVPDALERLWKFKAGNRVDLTPVSSEGRIYFSTAKGGLFAIDLKGEELWKISIAPDSFGSPPLIADGMLVVSTTKGFLKAFETATGKEKWSYD